MSLFALCEVCMHHSYLHILFTSTCRGWPVNFHFGFLAVDSRHLSVLENIRETAELLESFDCDPIASLFSWLSRWYTEDVPFKDDFLVYHKHIFAKAKTPD